MAVRQYIGARYVPKFFDWDGSPEWRSGVQYESLTIVTRNGNSYTSKIPVPSNIGAPENNPDYWVSTGIYNEQVNSIRQLAENTASDLDDFMSDGAIGTDNLANNAVTTPKINSGSVTTDKIADSAVTSAKLNNGSVTTDKVSDSAITTAKLNNGSVTTDKISDGAVTGAKLYNGSVSTDKIVNGAVTTAKLGDGSVTNAKLGDGSVTIDKIAPRYVICVGDSYQEGYNPSGNNQGWGAYLLSMFGYNGHNILGVGGAGFGATSGSQYDFTKILADNPPNDIDYDKVTDIVVGGGYNDFNRATSDIGSGIVRFYNHCKSTYPNARIWVAPIGWAWSNNQDSITPVKVGTTFRTYMNGCKNKDMIFINSCMGVLLGCNGLSTADYKHPTEAGNREIASAIHAAFNGLEYTTSGATYNLPITNAGWSGSVKANVYTCAGMAFITFTPVSVSYSGSSVQLNYFMITFAHHPFMCMLGQRIGSTVKYGNNYANTAVAFEIQNSGACAFGMQLINPERTNYVSATSFEIFSGANPDTTFAVNCANGL